jgi:hypothetical protein
MLGGSTTTARFSTAPEIPAAEGTVEARQTDNGNNHVKINLKHMAPAMKVDPEAATYVAWVAPIGGKPVNIGALRVDDNLKASLDATTPLQSFDVYITAEASPTVQEPKGKRFMTARIERTP